MRSRKSSFSGVATLVMARTFGHDIIEDLARYSTVPVINGLTDLLHPCQALADYLTLKEVKGDLEGKRLAYVGDGNNVAHSLMNGGARLGVHVTVVTPEGYAPSEEVLAQSRAAAQESGVEIEVTDDVAQVGLRQLGRRQEARAVVAELHSRCRARRPLREHY